MSKHRIGRYAFDLANKLPDLSDAWADAYAVDSVPDYPGGLYALLLNHKLPPRIDVFDALEGAKAGALQSVIAFEVVHLTDAEKIGFVLEQPTGLPLMRDLRQPFQGYKEDNLRNQFVLPLFNTLVALHDRTLFHGAISPLHIYAGANLSQLMLGECVTLPPGYRQPALFETIERAQCRIEAKGDSTTEDDLYALGISTYLLAAGQNPFANLPDDDLIRARLEVGSSTLMLNYAKLPSSILELVRGLCGDQPKQRWSLGDLENWIAGQRVAPRNISHVAKASRALPFNGKEYVRARTLASVLQSNPAEVRQLVESKEILRWLNRSLGDMALYEEAYRVLDKTNLKSQSDDMLAARLAMLLDPQGPIRYKNLQIMPAALGTCMAVAYIHQDTETIKTLSEIILSDLVSHWISMPGNGGPFLLAMAKEIDRTRDYINVAGMGNGIERVMYELQPYAPCYSEYLPKRYIQSPKHILPALDELTTDSRRPTEPLDRHMSSFLSARMGRGKETVFVLAQTNKTDTNRHLSTLDLLSQVQNRYSVNPVPRLAGWLLENLRPALDRFHNRKLRQSLQQNLSKIAAQGELDMLLRSIDSPEVVEGDLRGFRDATRQFRHLTEQIQEVTVLIENKHTVGQAVGHRVAAGVAVLLAMLAVAAALAVAVR